MWDAKDGMGKGNVAEMEVGRMKGVKDLPY